MDADEIDEHITGAMDALWIGVMEEYPALEFFPRMVADPIRAATICRLENGDQWNRIVDGLLMPGSVTFVGDIVFKMLQRS